jgi:hypothetical protein
MKTLTSLLRIALGLLALMFTVTLAQAKEDNAKERGPSKEMLKKYDANKDGALDDAERATMKANAEAREKEMKAANLAKYDTNKDGKLDDNEKAAMKADKEAAQAAKKAEMEAKHNAKKAEHEARKAEHAAKKEGEKEK